MSDQHLPEGGAATTRRALSSPHASLVEAEGIVVELVESKVFLRGHVRTVEEREEAERAVWRAPGVTAVENHVIVVPDGDRL